MKEAVGMRAMRAQIVTFSLLATAVLFLFPLGAHAVVAPTAPFSCLTQTTPPVAQPITAGQWDPDKCQNVGPNGEMSTILNALLSQVMQNVTNVGNPANLMCNPVKQECGCGQVRGFFGGCRAGSNMYQCPCVSPIPNQPGAMVMGICTANNICQGQTYTDLAGKSTGVGDIGGIVGDIFKGLLDKIMGGGGGGGGTGVRCILDGTTVEHGASRAFFSTSTISSAATSATCSSFTQSRTCTNGTFSGGSEFKYATCAVRAPGSCVIGGLTISHGATEKLFSQNSVGFGQSCESYAEFRTCSNGTLSGTDSYRYKSCASPSAASCTLDGTTVAHSASHTFYSRSAVQEGETCGSVSQTRVCANGTLSGSPSFRYKECTVPGAEACTLDGTTVAHGAAHIFFRARAASSNAGCVVISQARTCADGTLSGDDAYKYQACTAQIGSTQATTTIVTPGLTQAVGLLPGGTRGDIQITGTGATIFAGSRDVSGGVEVVGFYGADTFGSTQPQGLVAGLCQKRPWATSFVSYVIPPSFFDGLCSWRGYQVGFPTLPSSSEASGVQQTTFTSGAVVPAATSTAPLIEPKVDIWAVPERVSLGARTSIFWTTQGVTSCSVRSSDGSFSENTLSGGATTVSITRATAYSISCLTPNNVSIVDHVVVELAI